ncbi:hypothetical protein TELCIR_17455, partial [Teladorsagia circumcincta]
MQFFWPVNTPLEVHELVGPERFTETVSRKVLISARTRYRKRVYFSYCSLMHEDLKKEHEKKKNAMERESIREKQEKAFKRLQQKHNVTTIVIENVPPIPRRPVLEPAPPVPAPETPTCNGSVL